MKLRGEEIFSRLSSDKVQQLENVQPSLHLYLCYPTHQELSKFIIQLSLVQIILSHKYLIKIIIYLCLKKEENTNLSASVNTLRDAISIFDILLVIH